MPRCRNDVSYKCVTWVLRDFVMMRRISSEVKSMLRALSSLAGWVVYLLFCRWLVRQSNDPKSLRDAAVAARALRSTSVTPAVRSLARLVGLGGEDICAPIGRSIFIDRWPSRRRGWRRRVLARARAGAKAADEGGVPCGRGGAGAGEGLPVPPDAPHRVQEPN